MQAFGHVVIAWLWLDIACVAAERRGQCDSAFLNGKMHAARYFFHYELPRVDAWLKPVRESDDTFSEMDTAWF
jgi:butyryl-CoA dehydrogenase